MREFSYEAMSRNGAITKGVMSAPDEMTAAKQIEAGQLIVIELKPVAVRPTGWKLSDLYQRSIPKNDITIMFSDLAALAKSRLRLDEAISLMLQELELGSVRQLLEDLLRRLKGGESLSSAMGHHPAIFEKLEIEMLRLAEASGAVDETLHQIALDRELRAKVENQIYSALRYPMFLLLGSIGVLVFFLIYVIPQFELVLSETQAADGTLGFVFLLSRALNNNSDAIMLAILVLLIAAWIAFKQPAVQSLGRQMLLRMPIVGTIAQTYRNARICQLIAQTQQAGVQLTTALSVIGPAVDGPAEYKISKEAVAGLRQGRKLADVLKEYGNLHDLALRMIRIGEESSQVSALASRAADLYEARTQRQIARLVAIVGPATLILISTVIGGLIVLIMTALLSINDMVAY